MTPRFSIIMPTYGVESYIADAVADVLTQSFSDFELIIVDDCSPDRSAEVARAVAGDDERVRIVHHEHNRGVSQARNTGIDCARGTWLLFLDPDDRYDERLLERVAACIERHDPDLVVFGHVQRYFDANGKHLYDNPIPLDDAAIEAGPALGRAVVRLESQTHLGYPWNKAYRASIIEQAGLRFEDDAPLIEDILFNVAYMKHVRSVALVSDELYRYAKRLAANLTNEYVPRYFEVHHRRIREVRDLVEGLGALDSSSKATLGALYGRYIISALERNLDHRAHMNRAEQAAWLRRLFEDDLFSELIPPARSDESTALRLALKLLKTRNVAGLLAFAHAVHLVRTRNTTLFTKAKSKR